ncbi:MAG: hypothetical protein WC640_00230 [Candidatus Paceibacterota bacterium]|jgi:hypothetical protein
MDEKIVAGRISPEGRRDLKNALTSGDLRKVAVVMGVEIDQQAEIPGRWGGYLQHAKGCLAAQFLSSLREGLMGTDPDAIIRQLEDRVLAPIANP